MTTKQIDRILLRVINTDIDIKTLRKLLGKVTIDKERGCWLQGDWSVYHYIQTIHGKILAHRFTHWAFYYKIPDNQLGCHRCDRPGCINPDHIFSGSSLQNFHDAIKKGRVPKPGKRIISQPDINISDWKFDSIIGSHKSRGS